MTDQYEETTIETTDVGFTFAGGETEAASTNIGFQQGISVNLVSNESTLFLTGLDVIRECGLVIDCHHIHVHSRTVKRYLRCAIILPTGHLALETMPSKKRRGTASNVESCPLGSALGSTTQGAGARNAFARIVNI